MQGKFPIRKKPIRLNAGAWGAHTPLPRNVGTTRMGNPPRVYIGRFQYRDKILRFKFDIGDLVLFQTPHMDIREWEKGKAVPYQMGMITFREKAGYKTILKNIQNAYYHVLLPFDRDWET